MKALERLSALTSSIAAAIFVVGLGMALLAFAYPGNGSKYTDLSPGQPVRLIVRSLHINAAVVPIPLVDGVLDPPRDYLTVGWWSRSAQPGDDLGQTVITGHTVHTGGGAMDDIGRVRAGSDLDVRTQQGTMRYEVDRVRVLSKDALAAQAAALFGQDRGDGRLVLVTCTDWNGSSYESNVVVFAHPLGEPRSQA